MLAFTFMMLDLGFFIYHGARGLSSFPKLWNLIPMCLHELNQCRLHRTPSSLGWKRPCTIKNTFWQIEGVFSNVNRNAIVWALSSLNLYQNLVWFTELLLKSRIITSTVGASVSELSAEVHKLVFYLHFSRINLAANWRLRWLESSSNNAIAYADDIATAASRICPHMLNVVPSIVLDWIIRYHSKTDNSFH